MLGKTKKDGWKVREATSHTQNSYYFWLRECLLGIVFLIGSADPSQGGMMTPLAQDFSIAARVAQVGRYYIHDPGIARMPSGAFLVAAPCLERATEEWHGVRSWATLLSRSSDGGKTWISLPTLPYSDATPFVYKGTTYMFVQSCKWKDIALIKSTDEGETWSQPATFFQGTYWNCHTGMVIDHGHLFWAFNSGNYQGGIVVISGDLS